MRHSVVPTVLVLCAEHKKATASASDRQSMPVGGTFVGPKRVGAAL